MGQIKALDAVALARLWGPSGQGDERDGDGRMVYAMSGARVRTGYRGRAADLRSARDGMLTC